MRESAVVPMPRMRPATAEDAEEIVHLLADVAMEGMIGLDPTTLCVDDEVARLQALDAEKACALVIELAGRVQGFAVSVRGVEPAIAHTAVISVAVARDCRRRGFGRLLLAGVRAWADTAGVRKLVAGVCDKNRAALALFHRADFTVEGIRRAQVRVGGVLADEVLFGLILPAAGVTQISTAPRGRPARRGRR